MYLLLGRCWTKALIIHKLTRAALRLQLQSNIVWEANHTHRPSARNQEAKTQAHGDHVA